MIHSHEKDEDGNYEWVERRFGGDTICFFDTIYNSNPLYGPVTKHKTPQLIATWRFDTSNYRMPTTVNASIELRIGYDDIALEKYSHIISDSWNVYTSVDIFEVDIHYPAFMCVDMTDYWKDWGTGLYHFFLDIGETVRISGILKSFRIEYFENGNYDNFQNPVEISSESTDTPKDLPGQVSVSFNADSLPPSTDIEIGLPSYTDSYKRYISSQTPINLFAEDFGEYCTIGVNYTTVILSVDKDNDYFTAEHLLEYTKIKDGFSYNSPYFKGDMDFQRDGKITTEIHCNEEGFHQLRYSSTDCEFFDKQSFSEDDYSIDLYVDMSPPLSELLRTRNSPFFYDENELWISPFSEFVFFVYDQPSTICKSGLKATYYKIYEYETSPDEINWIIWDTDTRIRILDECKHTIEFYSDDKVDNIEPSNFYHFRVDGTPPKLLTHDPNIFETTFGTFQLEIDLEGEDQPQPNSNDPCIVGMNQIRYRLQLRNQGYSGDLEYDSQWQSIPCHEGVEVGIGPFDLVDHENGKTYQVVVRYEFSDRLGNTRYYLAGFKAENLQIQNKWIVELPEFLIELFNQYW